jgi:tryptophan-rich sensory protein
MKMSYIIDNIINYNLLSHENNTFEQDNSNNLGSIITDKNEVIDDKNIEKLITITETPVIETVITETEYLNYNHTTFDDMEIAEFGMAESNLNDMLILMPDYIRHYGAHMIKRLASKDMKFVFIVLLILNILILSSMSSGLNSDWYNNQKNLQITNIYVVGIFWFISIIMSYLSIFLIWKNVNARTFATDFVISNYFIIGAFLTLLWSTSYFQANNVSIAYWFSFIILMYQFWLTIVIWHINRTAALFLFPLFLLYAYIFYNMGIILGDDIANI